MARMNRWHAECSRKALRDIVAGSHVEVPATPAAWLLLETVPRPPQETSRPERVATP